MMAASILEEIFAARRISVAAAELTTPLDLLRERAGDLPSARDFRGALQASPFALIAEVKKGSPSRGVFREDFNPVALAEAYAEGGASAISIVTEPDFFWGSLEWLSTIREAVPCPLLRKDFTFSEYQVWEARAHGADAILLILAMLTDSEAAMLLQSADDAGVHALVEVHNKSEASRAGKLGAKIIGVNNRNLSTFDVSLDVSKSLTDALPAEAVKVSESGIHTFEDCRALSALGYHAFLVGEALIESANPAAAVEKFRGQSSGT